MKVIAGLGNPGAEYAGTPHNAGFDVVDLIASRIGATWEAKRAFKCLMARGTLAGVPVSLVKPQTYMNLSGDSVAPVVRYHNATIADLVVVQDDIDLPLGRIRVRKSGSSGGHNGLKSIIERVGSCGFARVKVGVGKDRENVVAHVLGKFGPEERKVMDASVAAAADAVAAVVSQGPDAAMNAFNGWTAG